MDTTMEDNLLAHQCTFIEKNVPGRQDQAEQQLVQQGITAQARGIGQHHSYPSRQDAQRDQDVGSHAVDDACCSALVYDAGILLSEHASVHCDETDQGWAEATWNRGLQGTTRGLEHSPVQGRWARPLQADKCHWSQ
eukprot:2173940-Rhodomonas_salina.1